MGNMRSHAAGIPVESLPKRISGACGLLLTHVEKKGMPKLVISKISQHTPADMVGATRSCISFFLENFRE